MSQILSSGWPWALTIAGFAFLIIIHEFGHFIAAKATGMRVERFFLFFPPKIVSIKRGETEYGIGALPFGGFVKITGMNPDELKPAPADDEEGKSGGGLMTKVEGAGQGRHERAAAAGRPEARLLQPARLEADRGHRRRPGDEPSARLRDPLRRLASLNEFNGQVGAVESGTPAAAHLQPGDKLLAVDGKSFPNLTQEARGSPLHQPGEAAQVCRSAPDRRLQGKAARRPEDPAERPGRAALGDALLRRAGQADAPRLQLRDHVGRAVAAGGGRPRRERDVARDDRHLGVFSKIFEPQQRKKIHGIVGISDVTQQAFQYGAAEALTLIAFISLSLAIINLFPFLPLDGGHIFWSLVEKVRGRPVPFRIMERASVIGFLLVMVLFAIGLSNDIHALNNGGLNIR